MPLYEYQCEKCGRKLEEIQKFSDSPLTTCEVCGGRLERLLSAPAIQFKGSGWYVTDYARKSVEGGSSSTNGSVASTETKSSQKEDGSKQGKEKESPKSSEPAKAS